MKLYNHIKNFQHDFIVEEKIKINREGEYPLYILEKSNVSTLEAVRLIARLFNIHPADIGFAGLKDKFGITKQYITLIKRDFPEILCLKKQNGKWIKTRRINLFKESGFCIKKVGKHYKKLEIGEIEGNHFKIKIRGLNSRLIKNIQKNVETVRHFGFPNYFGEQRFGTLKGQKDFILPFLLKEDYNKVVEIYLKNKGYHGKPGNWEEIYRKLRNRLETYEKDFILGLKRGLKPEKALRILPKNVRLMFNFSFQSFLWNIYLSRYIKEKYQYKSVNFINNWKLNFYTYVYDIDYLKNLTVPFTGKDIKITDPILEEVINRTLKEHRIKESDFEKEVIGIKVLTDGKRKAVVFPENLSLSIDTSSTASVEFFLPPGSYATVLLRNLLS